MNVRFLETFLWVARLNSFSLAADKLFSTQASISSRIAVLERELGVKLFVRDTRGVALTIDGMRILGEAQAIVDSVASLRTRFDPDTLTGRLRIGAMDTVVHTFFVEFFTELTRTYPRLEIEVTVDTALNLCDQLRNGMVDIIFQTDLVRNEYICSAELAELPMRWITSADCPVSEVQGLAALTRQRLVTFSRHSRPHQDVTRLLQQRGIAGSHVSCVNSVAAMTHLVRSGFGVGIMPPVLVRDLLAQERLRVVEDAPLLPPMPIVAAWHMEAGLEWPERAAIVARSVIRSYCDTVGPAMSILRLEPHEIDVRAPLSATAAAPAGAPRGHAAACS
jgi:DNA-binding transcriptional LysR family regulator